MKYVINNSTRDLQCNILVINLKQGERPLGRQEIELYWDSTYAIAMEIIHHYPHLNPENVGQHELATLIENLPGFKDDPAQVTERILNDIHIVWYEEANNL